MEASANRPLPEDVHSGEPWPTIEVLGLWLATAWFTVMLWHPIALPASYIEAGMDVEAHLLHLLMLAGIVAMYFAIQLFPQLIFAIKAKIVIFCVAVAISSLPFLLNLSAVLNEAFADNLIALGIGWFALGCAVAAFMTVWGYGTMARHSYGRGSLTVAIGSIISGALFVLCSFLDGSFASILVMSLPFVQLALFFMHQRRSDALADQDADTMEGRIAQNDIRVVLGPGMKWLVLSMGLIMGLVGSLLTEFSLSGYVYVLVGVASIAAGCAVCLLLKNGLFTVHRRVLFVWMVLPIICLFAFSLSYDSIRLVFLFLMVFFSKCFNAFNTAVCIDEGDANAFNIGYDLFNCESRTFDMLGTLLGWGVGMVALFFVDGPGRLSIYFFFSVVFLCMFVLAQNAGDNKQEAKKTASSPDNSARMQAWNDMCTVLADRYALSAREREVFSYLSRGRDRQYIHEQLLVSLSTVRTHVYNIYRKMNVHDQQELLDLVEQEYFGDNQ